MQHHQITETTGSVRMVFDDLEETDEDDADDQILVVTGSHGERLGLEVRE